MNTELDLKRLSIDRSQQAVERKRLQSVRKRWFSRFVLPFGVLFGFMILVGAAAGRRLLPATGVTVVPVIVKRAVNQQAGQPLFQAPGWIEPRPTPINVPALAPGVVGQLLVVEGQRVEYGEVIAKLISIDSELAVRTANAALQIREGEYERVIAERKGAELRVKHPVHLEVLIADADNELAKASAELEQLPFIIRSAEIEMEFSRESAAGKLAAGDGVSGVIKQRAEADFRTSQAKLGELRSRQPSLRLRTDALARKVGALKEQLDLMVEENRQLEEATAKMRTAAALRDEAEVHLEQAQLQLERMLILAPRNGRVLKLIASPGDRVTGMDTTAEHRSSTVVQMYDPDRLQVRVDVRLEDVPLVIPGQPVEIRTASVKHPIAGRVLQATSFASIQKNTLEVKVALLDTPPNITPEMLVTATFLAPTTKNPSSTPKTSELLYVPSDLVRQDENGSYVWLVDADFHAKKVLIEPKSTTADGLTEIASGLQLTDKLITSPDSGLQEGESVKISGEDSQLGML